MQKQNKQAKMAKSIITKSEIVEFLGLDGSMNCEFTEHDLRTVEIYIFRNLGRFDFYKIIKSVMAGVISTPWNPNTTYNIGQTVTFCGKCYECYINGTTNEPTFATNWKICTKKFTGACGETYTEFWADYLGYYIALESLRYKLPFIVSQATVSGLIRANGNSFDPTIEKETNAYNASLNQAIKLAKDNMLFFIREYNKENETSDCFKLFKIDEKKCEEKCNCVGGCSPNVKIGKRFNTGFRFS